MCPKSSAAAARASPSQRNCPPTEGSDIASPAVEASVGTVARVSALAARAASPPVTLNAVAVRPARSNERLSVAIVDLPGLKRISKRHQATGRSGPDPEGDDAKRLSIRQQSRRIIRPFGTRGNRDTAEKPLRTRPALLILDMINDLVHPEGKKATDGYYEQVSSRNVLARTAIALDRARDRDIPVIYIVVGFSPGYADWPHDSPLFRAPSDADKPTLGTWGTRVHDALAPAPGESIVVKRRVSPFHGTHLDLLLRKHDVDSVLLAGVATDLVVLSAARDAHDRDYGVTVLEDATATTGLALHNAALRLIERTAAVMTVEEALPLRQVRVHLAPAH
ncbi:cysteine hydrolase family protein [Actinokineospora sp.]|uniref:cysteine hydrolase family protein n=1 Tax=Actinokineospora sp. TaxID=1872133 RepID=UPI004037E886